jgi:pimeloyl-ACP methyl ester carboxylesterase
MRFKDLDGEMNYQQEIVDFIIKYQQWIFLLIVVSALLILVAVRMRHRGFISIRQPWAGTSEDDLHHRGYEAAYRTVGFFLKEEVGATTKWGAIGIGVVILILLFPFFIDVVPRTTALDPPVLLCERPSSKRLIVFIHGWSGKHDDTWKLFPGFVCQDERFSDSDVYSLNYPTFYARRNLEISGLTEWIRKDALGESVRQKYSTIQIVAHSMGGVIARKIVVLDSLSDQKNKIHSIVSVASPYNGADMAKIARALGVSRGFAEDITPAASFLKSLEVEWRSLKGRPPSFCFTSPQDAIVDRASARHLCENGLDYPQWDHIEMVKPENVDDPRYRHPTQALQAFLRH